MKKLGIMMAAAMLLVGTATFANATTPAKTAKTAKVVKTEQTAKPKVHHKHHKGHKKAAVAPKAK